MNKKKLTHAYLYAAGHAVLCYEKRDKDAGEVQWCEIHQKWTEAQLSFEGRITFGRGSSPELLRMCKRAQRIEAKEASTKNGSDNTKEAGIAVGGLTFTFGDYSDYLHLSSFPNLISAPWTYQPDVGECVPSEFASQWGNLRVAKVHVDAAVNARLKAEETPGYTTADFVADNQLATA